MKRKILVTIAAAGLTASVFGQDVVLDNLGNSGSISATSGGLVYTPLGSYPYSNHPGGSVLFDGGNYDLGVTVYGGSSAGSMSLIGTYTPANDPKGFTGAGLGLFELGPGDVAVTVPGVAPGGIAWIELQMWDYDSPYATGTFQSYAAALAHLDNADSVIFTNPTSNPGGSPPMPPPGLVGMPSVDMELIPEPGTLALAGLGLASLLALRRCK